MIQRFLKGCVKFILYVVFMIISYVGLLAFLLLTARRLFESGIPSALLEKSMKLGNDLSVYVTAAAALEFAVLTMLQQHITRQQDRALEFPDMCIERCELIISPEKIMEEVIGNDTFKGDYLIKMIFNRIFPVYYIPKIHKAWVRQRIYQSEENDSFERMKVKSSYFKNNHGNPVWNIQIDRQQCILDTVKRNQIENVQSLEFVYDVSWENQLLPWMNRALSKLYMRMVIHLEDAGVRNGKECSIKVKSLEIKKIPKGSPKV